MKFRLLATIMAVLASAHTARAQAMFPPETDNAALRYWFALAELWEPPDDDATRHLLEATFAGQVAWDETKLGPITDSNLDAILTMQRATKVPNAIGNSITGTGRGCLSGLGCEPGCCLI